MWEERERGGKFKVISHHCCVAINIKFIYAELDQRLNEEELRRKFQNKIDDNWEREREREMEREKMCGWDCVISHSWYRTLSLSLLPYDNIQSHTDKKKEDFIFSFYVKQIRTENYLNLHCESLRKYLSMTFANSFCNFDLLTPAFVTITIARLSLSVKGLNFILFFFFGNFLDVTFLLLCNNHHQCCIYA